MRIKTPVSLSSVHKNEIIKKIKIRDMNMFLKNEKLLKENLISRFIVASWHWQQNEKDKKKIKNDTKC